MPYEHELREHLAKYKTETLGVEENGAWKKRPDKTYGHILPFEKRFLNLLPSIRTAFVEQVECGEISFNLDDLPHLNSSQAMGINLFFPFIRSARYSPILNALGLSDEPIRLAAFEIVMADATNVDVFLETKAGHRLFVELKLKETGFGSANRKAADYEAIFEGHRPQLEPLIRDEVLTLERFKAHYQLFRYLSFLAKDTNDVLCIVVPKRNEQFQSDLNVIDAVLRDDYRHKVIVTYLEDVVDQLLATTEEGSELRDHFTHFKAKYISF